MSDNDLLDHYTTFVFEIKRDIGRKTPIFHAPCIQLARSPRTPLNFSLTFLPRDAMHKRGLCRHAVFVCVCVSVTFVSCQNEQINIS